MSKRLKVVLFVLSGLALSACATSPDVYAGDPRAVNQAMLRCQAQSDQVAASSMGQGALFAAAMQQQAINDCMAAAGHPIQ